MDEKQRAYAGMAWAVFENMFKEDTASAMPVLAELVKRLLADIEVSIPPTSSQLTRLMEEAVDYIEKNPLGTEMYW